MCHPRHAAGTGLDKTIDAATRRSRAMQAVLMSWFESSVSAAGRGAVAVWPGVGIPVQQRAHCKAHCKAHCAHPPLAPGIASDHRVGWGAAGRWHHAGVKTTH